MQSAQIKGIKRFKLVCKERESEYIFIGKELYTCAICGCTFDINTKGNVFFA